MNNATCCKYVAICIEGWVWRNCGVFGCFSGSRETGRTPGGWKGEKKFAQWETDFPVPVLWVFGEFNGVEPVDDREQFERQVKSSFSG
jgi:hypothetical protein